MWFATVTEGNAGGWDPVAVATVIAAVALVVATAALVREGRRSSALSLATAESASVPYLEVVALRRGVGIMQRDGILVEIRNVGPGIAFDVHIQAGISHPARRS